MPRQRRRCTARTSSDHPNNGWALFGLWQSLLAQGKKGPAAATEKQFKKAWTDADFELKRSAF